MAGFTEAFEVPTVKILFVCTGNSARSQMAEGFANVYGKGKVSAFSAGIEPKGINAFALEVMGEKGIDIHRQNSRHKIRFRSLNLKCL